jgi:tetratricopeptide (TPR) repeat protein
VQPAAAPAPPAKARPAAPPSESLLWYRHALDRIANGDPEKAITFLGQSIEADPRHVDAYMKRAELRFGLGEYRVALEDYRAVLAIDPELGAPVYWLAECHRRLGDRWGALDLYKQYVESTAKDVREDLRADAQERARELR